MVNQLKNLELNTTMKQLSLAVIAGISILLILANLAVFESGIYVDNSTEKFHEYAFNVSEFSVTKLISASFVHQNERHITENLIGWAFGSIVFIAFAINSKMSDRKLMNLFGALFFIGILLTPFDALLSKLVNGVGSCYGFSNVVIVYVGFSFAVIPALVSKFFKKFVKSKKLVKEFKRDLTTVFAMIWFFYLLMYSVGEFTNFVHVVNGAMGFVIGFYFSKKNW